MSEEQKVLTKQIAEQYNDGKLEIYTSAYTMVEPEAAEILVGVSLVDNLIEEGCEPGLSLNGLSELPVAVALALSKVNPSKFEENRLYLRGLKTLQPDVAKALARCTATIDLSGLPSISDEAAAALGEHAGCLYLDGLLELSENAATGLARQKGKLRLNGIKTVSDAVATALISHSWPVVMNTVALSNSPAQTALRAKIEEPLKAIDIGVLEPLAEQYGCTRFKICWDLDDALEQAGFDVDWSQVFVMYDFTSGKAWKFEVLPEAVEKGAAIPYLDGELRLLSPDGQVVWSKNGDCGGAEEHEILSIDESKVAETIQRVHAHALELVALRDTD
jgi:hypothetical protein